MGQLMQYDAILNPMLNAYKDAAAVVIPVANGDAGKLAELIGCSAMPTPALQASTAAPSRLAMPTRLPMHWGASSRRREVERPFTGNARQARHHIGQGPAGAAIVQS